jgi:sucrose phosphorylase
MSKSLASQPHEHELIQKIQQRVIPLLNRCYPEDDQQKIADQLYQWIAPIAAPSGEEDPHKWSQDDILLITYGDSIYAEDETTPLAVLHRNLREHFQGVVTTVHILPFCPYSSDDGFAVIDYRAVNPELGTWDNVRAIAQDFDLMADLVLNHISSQSDWFQQFTAGEEPGCHYFITVDPQVDLSQVVRPRSSPLLVKVDTPSGEKHVWATFSADQIDLNFANPDVFLEIISVLLKYVQEGARYIRLDAVGFLWKKIGTPCIHLPETHAIIRAIREVLQLVNPAVVLITETNVPNRENLSYFGNRNEAHAIYNFSLPPLLLNALIQGRSNHLKTWMMSMPPAPFGCTYLNFMASHDGVGLRPAEGLLDEEEYEQLLSTMQSFGGKISYRQKPDGSQSPYELNISLFDALKGTVKGEDQWQIPRFLCAQTILMSLEGIPAFYIHSFLATSNDYAGVERTGINRSINRYRWAESELNAKLTDPSSPQSQVMQELSRLIQIRRQQPAFHPNATQYTLHPLNLSLFVFWRQSMMRDQSIFSIHNLSDQEQVLRLSDLNLVILDPWMDLISGTMIEDIHANLTLAPYQSAWLTNKVTNE